MLSAAYRFNRFNRLNFKSNSVTVTTTQRRATREDFLELLGSMRFAISLLVFICVASLIGTVLAQNQPLNTYIDQFGPFWVALFDKFAIWNIYNTWWFIAIMGFLVLSTTLCVWRNAPRMLKDASSFREQVRGSSLRAFPDRMQIESEHEPAASLAPIESWLKKHGYAHKVRYDDDGSYMVAAKKGGANRLGYICGHLAIVVICVGGILDSELPIRIQVWLSDKSPITENMFISQVPESGRLSLANPSFSANMILPEGAKTSHAIVNYGDGVLVQPLPFVVDLKQFVIDYYSTGMPSNFQSMVEVIDEERGERFTRLIEVNEPLRYRGVTIYQSGFDDGGSNLRLQVHPLTGASAEAMRVQATVGDINSPIVYNKNGDKVDASFTELRVFNVEDLTDGTPQPRAFADHVAAVSGSGVRANNDHLTNVGPSLHYKITTNDGQSFDYVNYMAPMMLDDFPVFLLGMRRNEADFFRYVRIPADASSSMEEFMQLRAAANNPELLKLAAQRFAFRNGQMDSDSIMEIAAQKTLETFVNRGFNGIIEPVPEAERERILAITVPMLQLTLLELRNIAREENGLAAIDYSADNAEREEQWVQLALLAFANLPDYPAPVVISLDSFEQVQASVFQVVRSPGMYIVYTGSLLLTIGIFTMIYIRDRRIWVWVRPDEKGSLLTAAMTSQRRNLDFKQEFQRFQAAFSRLAAHRGKDNV